MGHALGLAVGAALFWVSLGLNLSTPGIITSGIVALLAAGLGWRMGAADREGALAWRAPQLAMLMLARAPAAFLGAARVAWGAVAGGDRLSPGFLRLRVAPASGLARAAHLAVLSAAPDALVADADESSILLHVWAEPATEPAPLLALEQAVIAALDGKERSA